MFNGFWLKVTGFLSFALAVAIGAFKWKSSKLKAAQHEIKIKDKKNEISTEQARLDNESAKAEAKKIEKEIKANAKKNKRDKFNYL